MEHTNRRNLIMASVPVTICARIINHEQTMIMQHTNPAKTPFNCYIYNTDRDEIIGEFTCDSVTELAPINHSPDNAETQLCATRDEIVDYCRGATVFAWHISNLEVYTTAKTIADIKDTIPINENDEFTQKVIQYCLDNGSCLRHAATNNDGSKNFTTNREISTHPAGKIRYVGSKILNHLLSPRVIEKTRLIIDLHENRPEKESDLIHLERWIAICDRLNCNEMNYEDAKTIIDILWRYGIDANELLSSNAEND